MEAFDADAFERGGLGEGGRRRQAGVDAEAGFLAFFEEFDDLEEAAVLAEEFDELGADVVVFERGRLLPLRAGEERAGLEVDEACADGDELCECGGVEAFAVVDGRSPRRGRRR